MTAINDISDLVRIIQDDPAWAETLRSVLLSQELLRLPERFADFAAAVAENSKTVNARLQRLEEDVAELKAGQQRLEGNVTELQAGQKRLEGNVTELQVGQQRLEGNVTELQAGQERLEGNVTELQVGQQRLERTVNRIQGELGNLSGSNFERKAATMAIRIARRDLGLSNPTLIHPSSMTGQGPLRDALNQAVDADPPRLTEDEAFSVESCDAVMSATNRSGSPTYVLLEAAVTVRQNDVRRASERAAILQQATGVTTLAVVIGDSITGKANAALQDTVSFAHLPLDRDEDED